MSVSFSFDHQYMPDELVGEIMSAFADGREVLFDGQLQIVVEMEDGVFPSGICVRRKRIARGEGANLRSTTSGDLSFEKPGSLRAPPGAILRDSTHFY